MITPEQVAAEVVDAGKKPQLPLRIPIGGPGPGALPAARHVASADDAIASF